MSNDASFDGSTERFSFLFRQEYLLSFSINLVLYGMYTSLILLCVHLFSLKSRRNKTNLKKDHSHKVLLSLNLLLWLLRTGQVICEWLAIWSAFIEHGDTADDVLSSLYYVSIPGLMSNFLSTIKVAIADGIMVWRCWVVSGQNWRAAIIPFTFTIISAVVGLIYCGLDTIPGNLSYTQIRAITSLHTAQLTLSVTATIVSTVVISSYILRIELDMPLLRLPVATTQNQSSGSKFISRRRGVSSAWTALQIVIESAALYSVAGLIYIPFVASFSGVPQNSIFLGDLYAQMGFTIAVVVSPALIMLRALLARNGNGRQQYTEWSSGVKSTLQFNPRPMDLRSTIDSDLEAETVQAGSEQINFSLGSYSNPHLGFASSPSQLQKEKGMVMETVSWAWYRDRYALTWLESREPV